MARHGIDEDTDDAAARALPFVGAASKALPLLAAATVALPFVAALGWTGYDHRGDFISELGAVGAPRGAAVTAAFGLIGVALLAATVGAVRRATTRWLATAVALVGGGLGVAYAVSGVARCDAGCPDVGAVSDAQAVHNLAGVAGYSAAIVGLAIATVGAVAARRRAARTTTARTVDVAIHGAALAVTVVSSAVAEGSDSWKGVAQRSMEIAMLAWLVWTARRAVGPSGHVGRS